MMSKWVITKVGSHKRWNSKTLGLCHIKIELQGNAILWCGLGHNEMIGSCECGSEHLDFIKGRESFEYPTDS